MKHLVSRRRFLASASTVAVGFGLASTPLLRAARRISPNEKLNLAMIGTANQAGWNLGNIAHENVVAICDVDEIFLRAAAQKFPQAKTT